MSNLISGEDAMMIGEMVTEKSKEVYEASKEVTVSGYKAIENAVVGTYTKVEDAFVGTFLTKDGETVAEAKERLRGSKEEIGTEEQK